MRQCVGIQRRDLAPLNALRQRYVSHHHATGHPGKEGGQMTASTKTGMAKQAPLAINPGGCQGQAVGRSPEI